MAIGVLALHTSMKGFKGFIREDEAVKESLGRLPPHHRKLVDGFEFRFEAGNTLKGDEGHVGKVVTRPKKIITISSPWNYGREFTLYHEIAHLVWTVFVHGTSLEKEWSVVVKKNAGRKKDENDEENFCHAYAATFVKHAPEVHADPVWDKFIRKVCKAK